MITLKMLKEKNMILRSMKIRLFTTKEDEECILALCHARNLAHDWAVDVLLDNYRSYKDGIVDNYRVPSDKDMYGLFTDYKHSGNCDDILQTMRIGVVRGGIKDAVDRFRVIGLHIPKNTSKLYHVNNKRHHIAYAIRQDTSYILDGKLSTESVVRNRRMLIELSTNEFDGIGGTKPKNGITKYWYNPRIVKETDGFYLTFSIPRDRKSLEDKPWTDPIGIDLGCKTTFQLSTEEFFNQPDVSRLRVQISNCDKKITKLYKHRKKQAYKQGLHVWELSMSNNEIKYTERRNKAYRKIHNKLVYFYYQIINDIVKRRPEAIVLETIYVKQLFRINPPQVRKEIAEVYFCMIRYMFESKCDEYSIPLYEVSEHYPSSLICNKCKYKHENLGKSRIFVCPNCGYTVDRDLNASLNLRDVYVNKEVDNIKWWNGHGTKLILMDKITNR